jgi:hypothetical protein
MKWWQGIRKADNSREVFQADYPNEEDVPHLSHCYGPFDTEEEATEHRQKKAWGFKEIEGTYIGDNYGR